MPGSDAVSEECVFPLLGFSLKQLPNCLKKKVLSGEEEEEEEMNVDPAQPQCCLAEKPQQVEHIQRLGSEEFGPSGLLLGAGYPSPGSRSPSQR